LRKRKIVIGAVTGSPCALIWSGLDRRAVTSPARHDRARRQHPPQLGDIVDNQDAVVARVIDPPPRIIPYSRP
jgi:hypothetical protein